MTERSGARGGPATAPQRPSTPPSPVARRPFGRTADGTAVEVYTLLGDDGLEVCVATLGATLQRVRAPDRAGRVDDVVLGFPDAGAYTAAARHQVGAISGRYANRISGARFVLDGVEHRLSRNEPESSLHGGRVGFGCRVWRAAPEPPGAVTLRYTSPAGEMGYPGTLEVEARYRVEGNELRVDLWAVTDAPTVVNLTSHAYWNLAGEASGAVDGHLLAVNARRFVAIDEALLPTGNLPPVAGTPLDFTSPAPIGERLRTPHPQLRLAGGLDHGFVIEREVTGALVPAARLLDPATGRSLELLTTEQTLQVYTANSLACDEPGLGGRRYRPRDGVALEAQRFADAPNRPEFPSAALRPGEIYAATTLYRLGVDA
jgi:aldose 1-epimerase